MRSDSDTMRAAELGPSGHAHECPDRPLAARASLGYEDIFCDGCHDWFTAPHILPNGTDIAWPSGWTAEDAMRWRAENKLLAVGG
jgi:hypothetical protein